MFARVIATAALGLLLSACGFEFGPVTRVVNGIPEEGRFISPEAYAAYAQGAYLESKGDLGGALGAYRHALDEDSHSAEIHTRIGAVLCKSAAAGSGAVPAKVRQSAEGAFADALDLDPEYAPAWHERAVCLASAQRFDDALAAALNGVKFDPDRIETSLLVIDLCERQGKKDEARAWLDALVTRWPSSRPAAELLLASARRERDAGRELRARELLRRAAPTDQREASIEHPSQLSPEPLDLALARGDLEAARRAALGAGVSAGELAARAVAAGQLELGSRQAELVASADPTNSDAWIAGLVAADLGRDESAFAKWLARLDAAPATPHPVAARLLADLLRRRSSAEAASAWRAAYGAGTEGAGLAEPAP